MLYTHLKGTKKGVFDILLSLNSSKSIIKILYLNLKTRSSCVIVTYSFLHAFIAYLNPILRNGNNMWSSLDITLSNLYSIMICLYGALRYLRETMIYLNEAMRLVVKSLTSVIVSLTSVLMFLSLLKMKTTSANACSFVVISALLSSFFVKIFMS